MARIVNFFDGAESETTPVIGNIIASGLVVYPDDATYESSELGAPIAGNIYFNSTSDLIRYYNGTNWITIVDETSTQTIENKFIDADDNNITNIDNDDIKVGAAINAEKIHDGSVTNTEFGYLDGTVSNIQDQLNDKQETSEKGQPNGYASLDGLGLVPASQLPSYVDDVLEFADLASFPVTGETGKIYIAIDSGNIYRWSGTIYVQISASGANLELSNLTSPTSINQNLEPDGFTRDLGSTSVGWKTLYLRSSSVSNGILIESKNNSGQTQLSVNSNSSTIPSGAANGIHIESEIPGEKLAMASRNSTSATISGEVSLESGNNTSTGNTGNVRLRTGVPDSGVRGNIALQDGSEGTIGHVWTSKGVNGEGNWEPSNIIINEYLVSSSSSSSLQSLPVNDTWYVPNAGWNLPLTIGTWSPSVKTFAEMLNATSTNGSGLEVALATSSTPGSGILESFMVAGTIGNPVYFGINVTFEDIIVAAPTTLYIQIRTRSGYGPYNVINVGFRNDQISSGGGKIKARRVA